MLGRLPTAWKPSESESKMHIFAHRHQKWPCYAAKPVTTVHLHVRSLLCQLLSSTAVWNVHRRRLDILDDTVPLSELTTSSSSCYACSNNILSCIISSNMRSTTADDVYRQHMSRPTISRSHHICIPYGVPIAGSSNP